MKQDWEYATTPYEANRIKERGFTLANMKVVENFFIPNEKDFEKIVSFLRDCKVVYIL